SDLKGHDGADEIIKVPLGTTVYDEKGEVIVDMIDLNQKVILDRGGKGGMGNWHFKSSINQTPYQYTSGEKRETQLLKLELKLIADVGLVGIPSAGKSTLLNSLTRASAKIGNYPFTTLSPNLGVLHVGNYINGIDQDIVLADIPGLIEGASEGKGLGYDFLRHIERTNAIVHLVDGTKILEGGIPSLIKDYQDIRNELRKWNAALMDKAEIVVLNKIDITEVKEQFDQIKAAFKKKKIDIMGISAYSSINLDELVKLIYKTYLIKQEEILNFVDDTPEKMPVKKYDITNLPNKRIIFKAKIQEKPTKK
ncbi:MAG: GTPase, partial [Patescibacteria group bacterium]|nr:GTPase [Patescibacteria group bacterium]